MTSERTKARRPADLAGVLQIQPIAISEDEKSYAYTIRRMISRLFLVEGTRAP